MSRSFTAEDAEIAEMKADESNRLTESVIGAAIEVHPASSAISAVAI
jgi:hypothetical protein